MAHTAQHLNVNGVCSKGWLCAVRFYVMSLQIICCSAFFAFATFKHNLREHFSHGVGALRNSIFPSRMIGAAHIPATSGSHALDRTIISGSSTSFAHLELFSALFAFTLNKCFLFFWAKFLGALTRTCVSYSSNMGIRSRKDFFACGAHQSCVASTFNNSLEFFHG